MPFKGIEAWKTPRKRNEPLNLHKESKWLVKINILNLNSRVSLKKDIPSKGSTLVATPQVKDDKVLTLSHQRSLNKT